VRLLPKYFLLGAIPALVAVGLASILDYQITRSLVSDLIEENTQTNLRATAAQIEHFFDSKLMLVQTLATSPTVRSGEPKEIVEFLRNQTTVAKDEYEQLYFADPMGTVYATDGNVFEIPRVDDRQRVAMGNAFVTHAVQTPHTGESYVIFSQPVIGENGNLVGGIGLAIFDGHFVNFMRAIEVGETQLYAVRDENNHLLASTKQPEDLFPKEDLATTSVRNKGTDYVTASMPILNSRWRLMSARPKQEIQGIYTRLAWANISAVVCGLSAAIILALVFSEFSFRPIKQIIFAFQRYASGDETVRIPRPGNSEFAIIATSFNQMADELSESVRQHKAHLASLEASETRFRFLFDNAVDGVLLLDSNLKILDANREICRNTGYSQQALIKKPIQNLYAHQDDETPVTIQFDEGTPRELECRLLRCDQSAYLAEIRWNRLHLRGEHLTVVVATDITHRKKQEDAVRAAKEFAESIVHALPGVTFVFDLQTRDVVFMDDTFVAEFGVDLEEMMQLSASLYEGIMHPDDFPRFVKELECLTTLPEGEVDIHEYRVRNAKGDWGWYEVRRIILSRREGGEPKEVLGIIFNVTDRRTAEQRLRWEKALLTQVMETSVAAILVINEKDCIRFLNTSAESMLHLDRSLASGKQICQLPWKYFDLAGKPCAPEENPFQLVSTNLQPILHREYRIEFDAETVTLISVNGAPLFDDDGNYSGCVFALTDITKRVNADRERDRLIRNLKRANDELKQFTYTVSHDLKSPLVTIRGFLGILQEDVANQDAAAIDDSLAVLDKAAVSMKQLLDDLLVLSRLGHAALNLTDLSLNEVLDETKFLLTAEIDAAHATISMTGDDVHFQGDPVQFRQVFQNLIDNTIKHSGLDSPRVEFSGQIDHEWVTIKVHDNGKGIDPEFHLRIFRLFDKLDPQSTGTGMGLAIVKRIVENHGGSISIESDGQGTGTTFILRLPVSPKQIEFGMLDIE